MILQQITTLNIRPETIVKFEVEKFDKKETILIYGALRCMPYSPIWIS